MMNKTDAPRHTNEELNYGWHLAVRTALVSSLLMAAIGVTLHTFLHVNATIIVAVCTSIGFVIGRQLPAARIPTPRLLQATHTAPVHPG